MWSALRAELAYSRPWLLGGLALAVGVAALVTGIFAAVGDEGPPRVAAAGIRGMFLIMAPLIVGFVVQTDRSEERRARFFLAAPITPRQLGGAAVLLPAILFGVGCVAAALTLAVDSLLAGWVGVGSLHIVGYVGGLILMIQLTGLVLQEATAAYRQRRLAAAIGGWAGFVLAVLFLVGVSGSSIVVQGPYTWPALHLANLVVVAASMAGVVALYAQRSDFTR